MGGPAGGVNSVWSVLELLEDWKLAWNVLLGPLRTNSSYCPLVCDMFRVLKFLSLRKRSNNNNAEFKMEH